VSCEGESDVWPVPAEATTGRLVRGKNNDVARSRSSGIMPNRNKVLILRSEVMAVARLEDVIAS